MRLVPFIALTALLSFPRFLFSQDSSLYILPEAEIEAGPLENKKGFSGYSLKAVRNQDYAARSLGELLSEQSPAFVQSYGFGGLQSLSFRGAGAARSPAFWKGVNITSPMVGQNDLSLLPVLFSDSLSVGFGGEGLAKGSGGFGGRLYLESPMPPADTQKYTLGQTFGSFGAYAATGGLAYGNSRYRNKTRCYYKTAANDFPYQDLQAPGKPEKRYGPAGYRQFGALSENAFILNNGSIEADMWYVNNRRSIPPSMLRPAAQETQSDQSLIIRTAYRYQYGKFTNAVTTAFFDDKLSYEDKTKNLVSDANVYSGVLKNDFRYSASNKLWVDAGLEIRSFSAKSGAYQGIKRQNRPAFYASLSFEPKKTWLFNLALRQEALDGKAAPFLPAISLENAIIHRSKTKLSLFGNAGRDFRPPTLNDLYWFPVGNPSLKSEVGYRSETGIKYEMETGPLSFRCQSAVYYLRIKNQIIWTPGVSGFWRPSNLKESRVHGWESFFSLKYVAGPRLRFNISANFSLNRPINIKAIRENDGSEGKFAPYQALNKAGFRFSTSYKDLCITWLQNYLGKRFITSDNSRYLPYYTLSDILVRYTFGFKFARFQVGASARNIFNFHYQSIAYYPMPGRNYSIDIYTTF